MRRDIDRCPRKLKDVLSDEAVRRDFLKGVPKNDAKVVKAFVSANASNALKTRPKVSYSALSLLFRRNTPAFVMFVVFSCMLGVLHRCVAFEGNWVSGIGDAQLPSVGVLFNVRHSHRRVFESEGALVIDGNSCRWLLVMEAARGVSFHRSDSSITFIEQQHRSGECESHHPS